MSTLTATGIEQTGAQDWRFVEFVMHTWTDSELAERCPVMVDDIDHPAPLTAAFTFCG